LFFFSCYCYSCFFLFFFVTLGKERSEAGEQREKECTGVPYVEDDLAARGVEGQWLDLGAEGWNVVLAFQLAGDASLHEGGLARTVVADKHHLEARRRAIVPVLRCVIGHVVLTDS
jgi:hypothetical protein